MFMKFVIEFKKFPDWFADWIGMKWGFWFSFWGLIVSDILFNGVMMITGPQDKPVHPIIFWPVFYGDSICKILSQQLIQLLALFSLQWVSGRNAKKAEVLANTQHSEQMEAFNEIREVLGIVKEVKEEEDEILRDISK
jgi:hypothetical protein